MSKQTADKLGCSLAVFTASVSEPAGRIKCTQKGAQFNDPQLPNELLRWKKIRKKHAKKQLRPIAKSLDIKTQMDLFSFLFFSIQQFVLFVVQICVKLLRSEIWTEPHIIQPLALLLTVKICRDVWPKIAKMNYLPWERLCCVVFGLNTKKKKKNKNKKIIK